MVKYALNGACTITSASLTCSHVAMLTTPAGAVTEPSALMPNRLLACRLRRLRPQSDSRMACATVTLAGTPVAWRERCAAAPTSLMNSAPAQTECAPICVADALAVCIARGAGKGTGGVIGPTSARASQARPG